MFCMLNKTNWVYLLFSCFMVQRKSTCKIFYFESCLGGCVATTSQLAAPVICLLFLEEHKSFCKWNHPCEHTGNVRASYAGDPSNSNFIFDNVSGEDMTQDTKQNQFKVYWTHLNFSLATYINLLHIYI